MRFPRYCHLYVLNCKQNQRRPRWISRSKFGCFRHEQSCRQWRSQLIIEKRPDKAFLLKPLFGLQFNSVIFRQIQVLLRYLVGKVWAPAFHSFLTLKASWQNNNFYLFFAFQDQEVFDSKTQPQETPQRDYGQHNDHDPKPPSDVLSLDLGTNPEKEATDMFPIAPVESDGQQDQSKLEVSYSCLEYFCID